MARKMRAPRGQLPLKLHRFSQLWRERLHGRANLARDVTQSLRERKVGAGENA